MTDPQTPTPEPTPTEPAPVDVTEPTATTAGEQDHADPEAYRGEDADAPADTGTPPQEG